MFLLRLIFLIYFWCEFEIRYRWLPENVADGGVHFVSGFFIRGDEFGGFCFWNLCVWFGLV